MSKREGKAHIHIEVDEDFKKELLELLPEHGMVSMICRSFLKSFVREMKKKNKQGDKSPLDKSVSSTVNKMSSVLPKDGEGCN